MGRDHVDDGMARIARVFGCDLCGLRRVLQDWRAVPDGWFLLLPPGSPHWAEPLELTFCSTGCTILWLRARAEAAMKVEKARG